MGLMRFLYLGLQKLVFLKERNLCFDWPEGVISAWACRLWWDIKVQDFRLFLSLSVWNCCSQHFLWVVAEVDINTTETHPAPCASGLCLSFPLSLNIRDLYVCISVLRLVKQRNLPMLLSSEPCRFLPFPFPLLSRWLGSPGTCSFSSSRAGMHKSPSSGWGNRGKGNGRRDGTRYDANCHSAKLLFTRALLWMHSDTVQMILGLLNNRFPIFIALELCLTALLHADWHIMKRKVNRSVESWPQCSCLGGKQRFGFTCLKRGDSSPSVFYGSSPSRLPLLP